MADDELTGMIEQVSTPQQLRQLLDSPGVDDKVIDKFVGSVGVDEVLDRVFAVMGTRFLPGKAGGDSGTVRWKIDTPAGRRVYHLTLSPTEARAERGDGPDPRTTLTMSTPNLLRLCAGRLNGVTAVMTGKIKVSGDLMFGAKMQGFFAY
jgi:alkyl sulfatase BDS1-like metallo-beta-lactamase superfamily hydrolase